MKDIRNKLKLLKDATKMLDLGIHGIENAPLKSPIYSLIGHGR